MTAYRYTIDCGRFGGIVFANNTDDGLRKLMKFYGHEMSGSSINVWKWEDDDYYRPIPDVYECYGE